MGRREEGEEEKVIDVIVSTITAYLHPQRILLFGSRALGRSKRYSEVAYAIGNLKTAFSRLKAAVEEAVDELDRDGVIQRFEFTFELLWKTLKVTLEYVQVIEQNITQFSEYLEGGKR
jgi:hypothetical protein